MRARIPKFGGRYRRPPGGHRLGGGGVRKGPKASTIDPSFKFLGLGPAEIRPVKFSNFGGRYRRPPGGHRLGGGVVRKGTTASTIDPSFKSLGPAVPERAPVKLSSTPLAGRLYPGWCLFPG